MKEEVTSTICSIFRSEIDKAIGLIQTEIKISNSIQAKDRKKRLLRRKTVDERNTTKTQKDKSLSSTDINIDLNAQNSIFKTGIEVEKKGSYTSQFSKGGVIKSFPSIRPQIGLSNQWNDSPIKKEEVNEEYFRRKTYSVKYIRNWYEKNNLIPHKLIPRLTNNIEFQSNILIDEIKVLLDNIQHYRTKYLNDRFLLRVFKNLDTLRQIKMNKNIEETCGLMLKISNGILLDFANFLEKFISVQPPHPEKLQPKLVKDEVHNFKENVNFLSEITTFLKSCFDVYITLTKQIDDMVLPFNLFKTMLQYLARARLNISNLICATENYKTNYKSDVKAVYKYKNAMLKLYKKNDEEEKSKPEEIDIMRYLNSKETKNNTYFKVNEEAERKRRLNRVLCK
jgi:hypothetical protein